MKTDKQVKEKIEPLSSFSPRWCVDHLAVYAHLTRVFSIYFSTANGRYFVEDIKGVMLLHETERTISPLDVQDAIKEFNTLPVRKCDFKEAFPDVE